MTDDKRHNVVPFPIVAKRTVVIRDVTYTVGPSGQIEGDMTDDQRRFITAVWDLTDTFSGLDDENRRALLDVLQQFGTLHPLQQAQILADLKRDFNL
jgi:hypothetical protein